MAVAIVQGDVVQVLTLVSVLAALETEGEVAEILGRILEAEGDSVETLGLTLPFFNIFYILRANMFLSLTTINLYSLCSCNVLVV